MALEVAVRNPERYYDILKTFAKFDGLVLDDSGVLKIYVQLYLDGVVYANNFNIEQASENENKMNTKKDTRKTKAVAEAAARCPACRA